MTQNSWEVQDRPAEPQRPAEDRSGDEPHSKARRRAAAGQLVYGGVMVAIGALSFRSDVRFGCFMLAAGAISILIGYSVARHKDRVRDSTD